jgi:hypothetical protein
MQSHSSPGLGEQRHVFGVATISRSCERPTTVFLRVQIATPAPAYHTHKNCLNDDGSNYDARTKVPTHTNERILIQPAPNRNQLSANEASSVKICVHL